MTNEHFQPIDNDDTLRVANISNIMDTMSETPISPDEHRYTIIGSGVIGLLTANVLADQGHDVTIVSRQGRDMERGDSTSGMAIGQFLPWVPEEHAEALLGDMKLSEVTDYSRRFYKELAQNPEETGVMSVNNIEFVRSDSPWPANLPEVMGVQARALEEPIEFTDPDGEAIKFDTELEFPTLSINTPKTVKYLAKVAKERGVKFEYGNITPDQLEALEGVIINAAGIGAETFDRSSEAAYFKGHTFILKPSTGVSMPTEAVSVDDLIMMPREDGTVVCGALYRENPDRPVPEEDEAEELFTRLTALFHSSEGLVEGLDPDLIAKSEVLMHSAGYRVELGDQGIRVAPDEENQRLLHAYGFGGIGWSVGPHFAQKIAEEAQKIHRALLNSKE